MLIKTIFIVVALWSFILGFLEGLAGARWMGVLSQVLVGPGLILTGYLLSPEFISIASKEPAYHQMHFWGTLAIMAIGVFIAGKGVSCGLGALIHRANQALKPVPNIDSAAY